MFINRKLSFDGNIYPGLYNTLSSLPENIIYSEYYNIKHPLGIFNTSISRVINAFKNVVIELNNCIKSTNFYEENVKFKSENLLFQQKELLDSLMSFIDDSYLILKSMTPVPTSEIKEIFTDKWLIKAKYPDIVNYKDNIKNYRDHLAPIVNSIKHNHGRLRNCFAISEENVVLGYYVEGMDNSFVGPDPKINNGMVFSYNYILKYHFYNLYEICYFINESIINAKKLLHNMDNNYCKIDNESKDIIEVSEKIMDLPYIIFPNYEFCLEKASVVLYKKSNDFELKLSYPSLVNVKAIGKCKVNVDLMGDGISKKFKFQIF